MKRLFRWLKRADTRPRAKWEQVSLDLASAVSGRDGDGASPGPEGAP